MIETYANLTISIVAVPLAVWFAIQTFMKGHCSGLCACQRLGRFSLREYLRFNDDWLIATMQLVPVVLFLILLVRSLMKL